MHTKLFENSLFVATLVAVAVAVSVSVLVCRTSKFNNSFFFVHIYHSWFLLGKNNNKMGMRYAIVMRGVCAI